MFEHYFGSRTLAVRGTKMTIMQDGNGLVLMVNHFDNKLDGFDYPSSLDIMHIGFIQESREAVDAMFAHLSDEGWGNSETAWCKRRLVVLVPGERRGLFRQRDHLDADPPRRSVSW